MGACNSPNPGAIENFNDNNHTPINYATLSMLSVPNYQYPSGPVEVCDSYLVACYHNGKYGALVVKNRDILGVGVICRRDAPVQPTLPTTSASVSVGGDNAVELETNIQTAVSTSLPTNLVKLDLTTLMGKIRPIIQTAARTLNNANLNDFIGRIQGELSSWLSALRLPGLESLPNVGVNLPGVSAQVNANGLNGLVQTIIGRIRAAVMQWMAKYAIGGAVNTATGLLG